MQILFIARRYAAAQGFQENGDITIASTGIHVRFKQSERLMAISAI